MAAIKEWRICFSPFTHDNRSKVGVKLDGYGLHQHEEHSHGHGHCLYFGLCQPLSNFLLCWHLENFNPNRRICFHAILEILISKEVKLLKLNE